MIWSNLLKTQVSFLKNVRGEDGGSVVTVCSHNRFVNLIQLTKPFPIKIQNISDNLARRASNMQPRAGATARLLLPLRSFKGAIFKNWPAVEVILKNTIYKGQCI